jgi:hypothetical protein
VSFDFVDFAVVVDEGGSAEAGGRMGEGMPHTIAKGL